MVFPPAIAHPTIVALRTSHPLLAVLTIVASNPRVFTVTSRAVWMA